MTCPVPGATCSACRTEAGPRRRAEVVREAGIRPELVLPGQVARQEVPH